MLKRLVSCILVVAFALTVIPTTVFAKTNNILYGDVNADGSVDLNDALILKRYIAEENPAGFSLLNADVNVDNEADITDLLMLKKSLAEWDIHLGPELLTVSFYDGDRLIDALAASKGYALGEVPTSAKSSKADSVLVGYFTDKALTVPFYAENPVESNMNVYAKYEDMDSAEAVTPTSFAQMDTGSNVSFEIVKQSGDTPSQTAATLTAKDGSDSVAFTIEDPDGDGIYTVSAPKGFNEGCSYELTLADGWSFNGKESSIRTAAFSIKKDIVENLAMSGETRFVKNANASALQAGDTVTAENVKTDDLICFYKETNPEERDYKSGNAYMADPEIWFKAGKVSGNKVTLEELTEADRERIYDIPDNFPVNGKLPGGNDGTLTLTPEDGDGYALDTDIYAMMAEDNSLEAALSKVSVGDFVSIYVSKDELLSEPDVYFGRITYFNSETGVITFKKSSAEEIKAAADLYIKPVVSGDELISEDAKEKIEEEVLEQVKYSGFAEEAAYTLANMAVYTDGFRSMEGVSATFYDERGNMLSTSSVTARNISKAFELKDGVKLTVEVITSGDQMHFTDKGAVQLAVGIDAQFEVETADGGKVVIDLSATFVQEISLGVTANGKLVTKEILWCIPVPIGVQVGASVDIKSFTGIRIDAQAYTEAAEDKGLMDQLLDIVKNPKDVSEILPDKLGALKKGLDTVGDIYDKIDELKGEMEQARNDAEKYKGYAEDIAMLWDVIDEIGELPNEEEWNRLCEKLGKTNISKDLMDMMSLSDETELEGNRYAEDMESLMAKYNEMLQKKTDWVQLVDKEMCKSQIRICGLVIEFGANFVVRADMNIAMGTSLQYEVGKRYNFWVKFGMFAPSAGSETMDLLDEQFAFQYYVMGKLGLKMGIKGYIGFALGSPEVAGVSISLEFGPYVKLYGFFLYSYERTREANTAEFTAVQHMGGALYMEFGLYLIVSIDASAAGGMLEVSYDFVNKEYPLLEAGNKTFAYNFNYDPESNKPLRIKDEDNDSTNGIEMTLPSAYRALRCISLTDGSFKNNAYNYDKYNITFSDPHFSIKQVRANSAKITVEVPRGTQYIGCDMTVTYKGSKLAFSDRDMQVTVPIYWTNLTQDEANEVYTAGVRVGNEEDGYETVWTRLVHKGETFTLPTTEELMELAGFSADKYESFSFPKAGQAVSLTEDTDYLCTAVYKHYTVTVNGVKNADGTTEKRSFTARYGEKFDFGSLSNTGVNLPSNNPASACFTKFVGVTTDAEIQVGKDESGKPVYSTIDLSQPVTGKAAEAIANGQVTATALYADDSVLVTYQFSGIDVPNHTERIRKGTASAFDFSAVAAENGMAVKSISPEPGVLNSSVTYMVECGDIIGEKYTITLNENGGSQVDDIERVGGALIGTLPEPTLYGHTFTGWFADSALKTPFTGRLMPKESFTLYAGWKANTVTVTFDVNNGNNWEAPESGVREVVFGEAYGEMPKATRNGNYGFEGWYTEKTGGKLVSSGTVMNNASAHTLYAHWRELIGIEADGKFTFETLEVTYSGSEFAPVYGNIPTGTADYPLTANDFTYRYKLQGSEDYIDGKPVNVGIYDVVITRAADDYYAAFEAQRQAAVKINRAQFKFESELKKDDLEVENPNPFELKVSLKESGWAKLMPDREHTSVVFSPEAPSTGFTANVGETLFIQPPESGNLSNYKILLTVTNPNYEISYDFTGGNVKNKTSLTVRIGYRVKCINNNDFWRRHWEAVTVENNAFTITKPGQLAYIVNHLNDKNLNDKSIVYTLGADLDMSAYIWETFSNVFNATLDGNGHTISGLYVSSTEEACTAGLFARVGGTVKNLRIEKSVFIVDGFTLTAGRYDDYDRAGAIAGILEGTVENCHTKDVLVRSTGTKATLGGIAGSMSNSSKIVGCTADGITLCDKDQSLLGGIVGYAGGGNITDCVSTGYVNAGAVSWVGGIAGSVGDNNNFNIGGYKPAAISGCKHSGTVTGGMRSKIGGIVGNYRDGYLTLENNTFDKGTPNVECGGKS